MDMTKISDIVLSQFPDFSVTEYAQFIKFIRLYYNHVEVNDFRNLKDYKSIDTSIETFNSHIKSELGLNIPPVNTVDDKFLLKHIKDFYSAKGTEESFKLLFRHLFNEEIEISYPKDIIFKPSSGKWNQDISVVVRSDSANDIFSLISNFIKIRIDDTRIENGQYVTYIKNELDVFVKRIKYIIDDQYEVFLDTFYYDELNDSSYLVFDNKEYLIQPTIGYSTKRIKTDKNPIKIIKKGSGFKIGSVFELTTIEGANAVIKVTGVDSNGGLKNVELISFGHGYTDDFYNNIISTTTKVVELDSTVEYDYTGGILETGNITISNYFIDYTTPDYTGEILATFLTDQRIVPGYVIEEQYTATLQVKMGILRKYPGNYSGTDGFLSDNFVLQDNHFYQIYSYVIKTSKNIDKYSDILKQVLNPAGFIFFGNVTLDNEFDLSAEVTNTNRFLREIFTEILVAIEHKIISFNKIISATDSYVTQSDIQHSSVIKLLNDYPTPIDNEIFSTIKHIVDLITTTDNKTNDFTKLIFNTNIFYFSEEYILGDYLETNSVIDSSYLDDDTYTSDYDYMELFFTLHSYVDANYVDTGYTYQIIVQENINDELFVQESIHLVKT